MIAAGRGHSLQADQPQTVVKAVQELILPCSCAALPESPAFTSMALKSLNMALALDTVLRGIFYLKIESARQLFAQQGDPPSQKVRDNNASDL
jgi:hypothetical protein